MSKKFLFLILLFVIFIIILISYLYITNIKKEKNWILTMYGNDDALQMMSFTIESNDGGLIIIDGGYYSSEIDVKNIESIIEKHNNKVNAWIITHFDNDHSGVFVNIYENHPEYTIDKIYCPDVFDLNIDYLKKDAPWETETFELFEKIIKFDLNNIKTVHIGDMISDPNLLGLKMKILSSYEPWMIEDGYKNIFNSGSMVFKLYGNEEDVLFMADAAYSQNSEYLMKNYTSDILKSDYLQPSHHGNALNINKEIYDLINPTKMFFCAPKWLREDDKYDTHNLIDYCHDKNIEVIAYDNTTYKIIIK